MEYLKIEFDIDGVNPEVDSNDINSKELILKEIDFLKEQGFNVVSHNVELDYIIIENDLNKSIEFKYFSITTITECDIKGNILNEENVNSEKLKDAKVKIIIEYLKTQNVKYFNIVTAKNYITFNCPVCPNKTNMKMCISIHGFKVKTFSETDCTDDKHQKAWSKWTKDLKLIWDESQAKKNLVYSLNMDYITKIIEKSFPTIIIHKSTGLLFKYDSILHHYVEMIDNERISDLETLIYKNFFQDDNKSLTCNQVRDLKKAIIRSYEGFKQVEFESSNLFNLKNGVYDFKLKQLFTHSKDYYFNYCSDITYNPEADSNVLDKFLKSIITEDDPITLTQRILGHIHYDGSKLEKGFMFEGTRQGRNGKGTFVKLLVDTLGKSRTLTMTLSNFFNSPHTSVRLKDKILYVEDDYKQKYMAEKEVQLLNKLISHGDEDVNPKGKTPYSIELKAVPIILANKRPELKTGDDGGFYKRWIIVNFKNEFSDPKVVDSKLYEKLSTDNDAMSSMFNYLITGYDYLIDWNKNNMRGNFFKNDEFSHVEDWRKCNSSVIQFFEDCCVEDENYMCSTREMYKYYSECWNLNSGHLSERNFIIELKEQYKFEIQRKWLNNKKDRPHCMIGCYFKPEYNTQLYPNCKILRK